MFKITLLSAVVVSVAVLYYFNNQIPPLPEIPEKFWTTDRNVDSKIYPFSINVSENALKTLKLQLEQTEYVPPLNDVNFEYGFNSDHLQKIVHYWLRNYKWKEREALLNSLPHFRTKILGLNIHFVHMKPDPKLSKGKKVLPLLIMHGWPGSVKEFHKVLPLLTTPSPEYDFVFEVIAPSLPGYGFSDAATVPGLGTPQMAQIMKLLMRQIGFHKFYVQGGDWGSVIGTDMATLYPENVLGFHSNLCLAPNSLGVFFKLFVGSFWPELIGTEKSFQHRIYPLSNIFDYTLAESGYLHIQATKPDTVGVALRNSPAGLAAYMLEKFSTWENYNWRNRKDGGLGFELLKEKKYSIDDLLDNVMIYWATGSITSSMRLYSEAFNKKNAIVWTLLNIPVVVPTVCTFYPYDVMYYPESIVRSKYQTLLYVSHKAEGGHFPAFELPDVFAADLWKAVCNIENVNNGIKEKCE